MDMKNTLLLAGALALTAQHASAAGLYGAARGGFTFTDDHDFSATPAINVTTELDNGYGVGVALGYDTGPVDNNIGLRLEAEYMYRQNEVDTHSSGGAQLAGPTGEINSHAYMANAYLDFHNGSAVTPYIGGGVGVAQVSYDDYGVTAIPNVLDDDDTVFAYQGIAGASYKVTPQIKLTADYRYFATEDPELTSVAGTATETEYATHNIFAGVEYSF